MRRIRLQGYLMLVGMTVVVSAVVPSVSALAQSADTQSLVNRLERLERDVQALGRQVYRGETPPSSAPAGARPTPDGGENSSAYAARIAERVSQLEAELRQVTGNVEDMNFKVETIGKRLDKLVSDIDFRLSALERRQPGVPQQPGGMAQPMAQGAVPAGTPSVSGVPRTASVSEVGPQTGGPVTGTGSGSLGTISGSQLEQFRQGQENQPPTEAPAAQPGKQALAPAAVPQDAKALPAGTPNEQYQYALSLLRSAEYDKAESAFQEFVDSHPDEALTPNARYWLGETYYVRGDFVRAADVFLAGYRQNPKSPKAPDSLLKLGMSLNALDKKKEACATFGKLSADFPDAPASVQRVLQREKERAECK